MKVRAFGSEFLKDEIFPFSDFAHTGEVENDEGEKVNVPIRTATPCEEQTDVVVIPTVCSSVARIFLHIHSSLTLFFRTICIILVASSLHPDSLESVQSKREREREREVYPFMIPRVVSLTSLFRLFLFYLTLLYLFASWFPFNHLLDRSRRSNLLRRRRRRSRHSI